MTPGLGNRAGFTLIELIAVVLVVAILSVLIFSAVSRGKDAAMAAKCVSNLRQLAGGVLLYTQDNNGSLPPLRDGFNSADRLHTWMLYSAPYVGVTPYVGSDYGRHMQKTIFWCPADNSEWQEEGYAGLNKLYCTKNSYLANNAVMDEFVQDVDRDGVVGPRKLGAISNPSRTIMLMEGGRTKWNMVGYHNGAISFFGGSRPGYDSDKLSVEGYHMGASNWAFVDGHIERLKYEDTYGRDFNLWLADK